MGVGSSSQDQKYNKCRWFWLAERSEETSDSASLGSIIKSEIFDTQ